MSPTPSARWIKLKELTCWNRRYLVFNLMMRNLKLRYRNSWLGGLWTVLLPAGSAAIFYFIFGYVIRVKTEHYMVFVLSGTLCWTFFASALSGSMDTVVQNVRLLNKVPLPPQALIYAEILTNLINLVLALPTLIVVFVVSGLTPHLHLLGLPFLIILLALQATGFGLLLGIGNAYFRDLKHLMTIVLQVWFYLTPVLYSLDRWPKEYAWLLYFNPLAFLFGGVQASILNDLTFDIKLLLVSLLWTVLLCLGGMIFLRKTTQTLVEAL